jgi:hypothetical protein
MILKAPHVNIQGKNNYVIKSLKQVQHFMLIYCKVKKVVNYKIPIMNLF